MNQENDETTIKEKCSVQWTKSGPLLLKKQLNNLPKQSFNYRTKSFDKRKSLEKHIWRKHNIEAKFNKGNKARKCENTKLKPICISKPIDT